jgi:putative ABC transport system ATP-binding protein
VSMVDVREVTRTYGSGATATAALRGVTFSIGEGRLVALRGRSGSGKTTLLNVVGGLDTPDAGSVHVAGQDVTAMGERDRMRLRRETVSYIFQSFGLLPVLSAAENVGVPLRITGVAPRQREERVALMLSIVGLADHTRQRPGELSGGQQQRVAIARALASRPALLLADEPTGSLDSSSSADVLRLLGQFHGRGQAILLVTHDARTASMADRVVSLFDGMVADDADMRQPPAAGTAAGVLRLSEWPSVTAR